MALWGFCLVVGAGDSELTAMGVRLSCDDRPGLVPATDSGH